MKTIKFFNIAVLAIVGAVMTSCSSDNNNEDVNPPQPVNTDKVVTLTTTVSRGNSGAGTRALTSGGVKTFAADETMAVIYKNTSGTTMKAVSNPLTAGDITDEGKSATFTVTLDDPDRTKNVTYIYPASMAKADGTVNYDALNEQNGTLAYISSNLDCCTNSGAWNAGALPELTLENQLAIFAFKVKGPLGGDDDRTSTISNMVISVSEGPRTYAITGHDENFIYVAIRPTSSATINFYASDGTKYYAKYLEGKNYEAGYMYELGLKMAEVIGGVFTVDDSGKKVYFSKGNLQATTSNYGVTWSWHFAPNQYARVGGQDKDGVGIPSGNNYINGNGTVTNDGNGKNIDLFGWSTSATRLGISNNTDNSTYGNVFVDWGSADEITACIGTGWRTLNKNEWRYLTTNTTRTENRFALASINGTRGGIILLPDDWKTSYYALSNINDASVAFTTNTITDANWTSKLEAHGAVFLPVTGQRNSGTKVNGADNQLHYWSSTNYSDVSANHMRWMPNDTEPVGNRGLAPDTGAGKSNGFSVRLVYDIK